MSIEKLKGGIRKRSKRRELALFIDGTGLDRATRRIKRKVDLPALVKGVTSGLVPVVARYYTLIPYEDDSRQHAFLDAVRRAGLRVIVKRLPPKGVTRQVSVDNEMTADIVAYSLGHKNFSSLSEYEGSSDSDSRNHTTKKTIPLGALLSSENEEPPSGESGDSQQGKAVADSPEANKAQSPEEPATSAGAPPQNIDRIVTVVCPSRDLAYPISLVNELGVDTVTADFGQFQTGDILKSASKWIDLSDSETIWRP